MRYTFVKHAVNPTGIERVSFEASTQKEALEKAREAGLNESNVHHIEFERRDESGRVRYVTSSWVNLVQIVEADG